jgi:hypothetical protein
VLGVRLTVSVIGRGPRAASRLRAGSYSRGVPFDTAFEQWQAGLQRLEEAPFDERPILETVTRRVQEELRRLLGGAFTTDELAELYDSGTGWVSDVAVAAAPDAPFAWDVRIVGDAAFARYVRSAVDFAGGRRG